MFLDQPQICTINSFRLSEKMKVKKRQRNVYSYRNSQGMLKRVTAFSNRKAQIVLFLTVLIIFMLKRKSCENEENVEPIIYALTPTYYRPTQKAELTRLSHLFRLVPNLFWVIVEDAAETSQLVKNVVKRAGLLKRSVLLHCKTPKDKKPVFKFPYWTNLRGVEQRNSGLRWIKKTIENDTKHSIVYFMDDDNTYSVELFEEMTKIKRGAVGIWGVGFCGNLKLERPIVENGKVVGFNNVENKERPFPIDMAGFAISCDLLKANPDVQFSYRVRPGFQETEILKHLTTREKLQPLGLNQIIVWHTRTDINRLKMFNEEKLARRNLPASDANIIE